MGGPKGRPVRPHVCARFVPSDKADVVECSDRASGGPGGRSDDRARVHRFYDAIRHSTQRCYTQLKPGALHALAASRAA